jgi:hypothetical protein
LEETSLHAGAQAQLCEAALPADFLNLLKHSPHCDTPQKAVSMKIELTDLTMRDLVKGYRDGGYSLSLANEQEQELLEVTAQFR